MRNAVTRLVVDFFVIVVGLSHFSRVAAYEAGGARCVNLSS